MAKQKGMKKRTYLTAWSTVFALLLIFAVALNGVCLYWDSALTIFFGEVGAQSTEQAAGQGTAYYLSDYASAEERTAASAAISREIVAEGAVLMKNENSALPLASGAKVSLFGIAAKDGKLGKELEQAGLTVNPTLAAFYAASSHNAGVVGLSAGNGSETGGWVIDEAPQSEYTADVKASYTGYIDAAVVLLTRTGAEGNDLPYDMSRYGGSSHENYLELNTAERDLLKAVSAQFETVIVLLDSANAMQMDFLNDPAYGVDACLWYARPADGISAVADILAGSINPSGRLTDTYAADNLSSPAMQNFGDFRYVDESGALTGYAYMNYAEGIYVGYKYYETRYEDKVLNRFQAGDYRYGDTVVCPFGFGLSYTTFQWSDYQLTETDETFTAQVTVTNTGAVAGKDVVEFYFQAPYLEGGVEKAAVNLVEYAKTGMLEPGASETVSVTFTRQDLASYDYKTERTYILDAGEYYVTAARDAHDAINNILAVKGMTEENGMTAAGDTALVQNFSIAELTRMDTAVTGAAIANQLDDAMADDAVYLSRSDWSVVEQGTLKYATGTAKGVSNVGPSSGDAPTHEASSGLLANLSALGYEAAGNPASQTDATVYPSEDSYTYGENNGLQLVDMMGVPYDDPQWDVLLNELKLSEMHALFNKSGWGSCAVESIGKPKTYEYDAPAGIANFVTGEVLYSYPCATQLAATWNQELQKDYGEMIGNDAIASNTSGWYAPGINIHRTPFGARNYEYYSEDGVLTGLCSAAVTTGAESKGIHVYLKHFAINDQDTNRAANNCVATWSTEQATREIYLRPFQYSIERGGARGIMLTMSRVGFRYSYGNYPLMTAICRDEWGFTGCYITDYTTTMKGAGADQYLAAGGNLIHATAEQTLSDVKADWSRGALREAVHGILYNTANSLAMNGVEKGVALRTGFPVYRIALIAFDVVLAAILAIGAFFVYRKAGMTEEQFQARPRMGRRGKLILLCVVIAAVAILAVIFAVWAYPLLVKALKI